MQFTLRLKCEYFFIGLLLAVSAAVQAVEQVDINRPYFHHYSVADGLSQVTIHDIAQDHLGFMWLATQSGIDKFDGYTFRHFNAGTLQSDATVEGSSVFSIAPSPDHKYLWLGTINGIRRFDLSTFEMKYYGLPDFNGLPQVAVHRMHFTAQGDLYAGSQNGLFRYDSQTDTFQHERFADSELEMIRGIGRDSLNRLWLGTTSGLYYRDENGHVFSLAGLADIVIHNIAFDKDGHLWVASEGKGVVHIDASAQVPVIKKFYNREQSGLADDYVRSVMVTEAGKVWAATLDGLSVIERNQYDRVSTYREDKALEGSVVSNNLTSLYQDQSGVVWVGSWQNGFGSYDPKSIKFAKIVFGRSHDVRTLVTDAAGDRWINSSEGVWRWSDEGLTGPYTYAGESGEETKTSVMHFRRGDHRLWIASRLGLSVLDTASSDNITPISGLKSSVYTLNSDSHGMLWLGTRNEGVIQYDADKMTIVNRWDTPLVTNIFPDKSGFVWVATIGGIYRIFPDTGEIQYFSGLSSKVVTWISAESQNQFWIGTQTGGLDRMIVKGPNEEDVSFQNVISASRLQHLSIGGVLEDTSNALWISTIKGIAKYEPDTDRLHFFDSRNGANETGYYIGGASIDHDGNFYFMGPQGLTMFNPSKVLFSQWQPKVYLTNLQTFNRVNNPSVSAEEKRALPLYLEDELVLTSDVLMFSVAFTALDYSRPNAMQYAYKLRGFDKQWHFVDASQRLATYTNLDPGQYILEVKASNQEGIWSPYTATVTISVLPPWWLTPLALLTWVALIIGITLAIYRWRVSSLQENANHLSELVKARTRELEGAVQQLKRISAQDSLTLLSNRRDFHHRANSVILAFEQDKLPFAIVLLDIDEFKQINDTYGHLVGDQILIEFAERLRQESRQYDIAARWGGEEFICLLPHTDISIATGFAERVKRVMSDMPFYTDKRPVNVSATIGVAVIAENETLEACIKRADEALYAGKRTGRNQVVVANEA